MTHRQLLIPVCLLFAVVGCKYAAPSGEMVIRSGTVQSLDRNGKTLQAFEAFDEYTGPDGVKHRCSPQSVAQADGRVFIVQTFGQSLLVLDATTFKVVGRVDVTRAEGYVVASPDGETVYYASNVEPVLFVIDAATLRAHHMNYPPGARGIGCMAMSSDGLLYLGFQRGAAEAGAKAPPAIAGPVNPLTQTYPGPMLAVYDTQRKGYAALRSIGDTQTARGDDSSLPVAMTLDEANHRLYVKMSQSTVAVHVYDTERQRLLQPQLVEKVTP